MISNELFGDILIRGMKKVGQDIGIISNVDGEVYRVVVSAVNGRVTRPSDNYSIRVGNEFQLTETYCSDVIRENKTVYYANVENFTSMLKHPCYLSHQLRSYIGTPLKLNGEIFGTLNYSSINPRKEDFSNDEINYIESQAVLVSYMLLQQDIRTPLINI